jgi:1,4-dihydroxy-2-naphthoate octaprenyltransferase
MSTNNRSALSKKNDSMLTAVALIFGIVAGILVYQLGDKKDLLVIIAMIMLVFGIFYLLTMPYSSKQSDYLPSQQSFRFVWGMLLTVIGALILINIYIGLQTWVLLVIILLAVALIALFLYFNKKEV